MENQNNQTALPASDVNATHVSLDKREISRTQGIPQTDGDLARAFILKSHSVETRRTYRTTLQTFTSIL